MADIVSESIAQSDIQLVCAGLAVFGDSQFEDALRKADELLVACLYDQRWTETWANRLETTLSAHGMRLTM
jgi:hypothetical protein